MQQQQQQQMGFMGGGSGGGGLTRFKSAPVSWFDSLLLEEPTEEVVLDNQIPAHGNTRTQCYSQVPNLTNSYDPTPLFHNSSSSSTFTRHNSSPPQLLATLASDDLLSFLDVDPTQQQQSLLKGEPSDSFSDMDMEKLFQDSVPCRVRAKRGCATHPRSIAERVRRTRISDRIRKLQELVPNMDKQTNTADMLEEAVEYVKFLQRQIEELAEHQKNCKCLSIG